MSLDTTELNLLANSFEREHDPRLAELACLLHLTETAFPIIDHQRGTSVSDLLPLHRRCVLLMASRMGFTEAEFDAASRGLVRTTRTASYLTQLPEDSTSDRSPFQPYAEVRTQRLLAKVSAHVDPTTM